jgi:prevent-host-death family protein
MKRVPIAEFKANCSRYVEEASQEDIVITRHGKAVARVIAETERKQDIWEFYESLEGKYPPPPDDLSTGRVWDAQS